MSDHSNTQQRPGVRIHVRDLHKSYGSQTVLSGIDLEVAPGEIFVIMGASGSGKTVLLKHIAGLEKADKGEIKIDGHVIDSPEDMGRYRMAMVFQSGALLNSLDVGDNVGLYLTEHRMAKPDEIRRIVGEKLEVVGLAGMERKMPSELSGGMKKRVAIARALVVEPQLILYDEPTSELDPLSAVVISEEIVRLNDRIGVTSLVVSHDRDLAFGIADRIAVIGNGRILAIGTPSEVQQHSDAAVREFLTAGYKRPAAQANP